MSDTTDRGSKWTRKMHEIREATDGMTRTMRSILWSFGWYLLGACTGALGVVWQYEHHSVITAESSLGVSTQQLAQWKADQEARFARQEQRNTEMAVALRKLQGVKQTWDVQMKEVTR